MAIQFTEEQQKVIDLRDRNILVSAAAGSGKTAVLVERILGLVMDEENPVDIDRLLIVTFTNAAASEMRERIGAAIEKKLSQYPDNSHLQRQATLLHHAQITTIDSFCLFVIRNNFNEIGLDPGFRVADTGEIELLKQDIIKELFEELLEGEETKEDFVRLLETMAYRGKEKTLEDAILQVNSFAESFPWPEEWLKARFKDYQVTEDLLETSWGRQFKEYLQQELGQMQDSLQQALAVCKESDGPYMYLDALQADMEIVDFLRAKSWQEQYEALQNLKFARLSVKKDTAVLPEKREMVKAMRDGIKADLNNLKKKYFSFSPAYIKKQMEETAEVEKTLLEAVLLFRQRFAQRKREKNLLDFGDMEHFALEILTQRSDEAGENGEIEWVPSKTALDYRSYFYEIMIDEYQDSNLVQEYLLQSISGELDGNHNRFMVGDLKQSIYKFRLARPEIFLEKYHTYEECDSKQQRIDLHKNFRSRKQVIDSVNDVFYQIMGESLGKIEYTHKEALYPGAVYPEGEEDYTTELLLLENVEEEERKAEARMIAERIRQMVGNFQVTDKETGELRPARYRDIVILLRTNVGWDEEFCNVLMEYGIPASVTSKTGYFSAKEVQIVLNFLRVIDNPRQDIPLYGVMKSLLGRFTEEEIVLVRTAGEKGLYENLAKVAGTNGTECDAGINTELREKAQKLLNVINRYRDLVYVTPIHKILRLYLQETGYLYYFAGMPGGEQRTANVKMLLEKAESYEKTSYFGLFHFIRYMEQLQKYDIDAGEAGMADETKDAVRIMSIHKSKGLEFPICFVSGLAKKFNQMDARSSLICDMDLGLGMEYRNPKTRVKNTDLRRNIISQKMQLDNLGEELRVLYVAMTRAKEKLILTGVVKDYEKQMLSYVVLKNRNEIKLPVSILSHGVCFLDYLLAATSRPKETIRTVLWNSFQAQKEIREQDIRQQYNRLVLEQRLLDWKKQEGGKEKEGSKGQEGTKEQKEIGEQSKTGGNILEKIKQNLSFQYSHENLQGLYAKTTVSELKMKAMENIDGAAFSLFHEPEIVPYIPEFIEKKGEVSGAVRGSAYHRVLELTDFKNLSDIDSLLKDMKQLEEEKVLDSDYLPMINKKKLQKFLESSLAKRMQEADRKCLLFKERPFVLGIEASRLDPKFPSDEKVLIQGIVDVFFEEDGELVIVDYKTDAIKTKTDLIKRYKEQLDYYGMALEQLTRKKVKEKILYSFALNQIIEVQ